MRVYFDASALVALATGEPGAAALFAWRLRQEALVPCLSDFARGEVIAAVASQVRAKRSGDGAVEEALRHLDTGTDGWITTLVERSDVAAASEWVGQIGLGLRLPDAIHIAIARRLDAALLTFDKRQHAAARTLGVDVAGPLAKDV